VIQGQAWFDLLAAGYTEGGSSIQEGFDCRTLVAFYLRRLGKRVPHHPFWDGDTIDGADQIAGEAGDGVRELLQRVEDFDVLRPELGLVLGLPPVNRRTHYRHLAVCCSERPAMFLSAMRGTGVHALRPEQLPVPIRAWRAWA
jgi:hypothetical protein